MAVGDGPVAGVVAGSAAGAATRVLLAVTGCDTAGAGCAETVAAGGGTIVVGVVALGAMRVEIAAGESDASELDAGTVDDVDALGAAAAAEPLATGATVAGAVTVADEPLATGADAGVLAVSPLDAELCAFSDEFVVDAGASAGVAPALELLAAVNLAADLGLASDVGLAVDVGLASDVGLAVDAGLAADASLTA